MASNGSAVLLGRIQNLATGVSNRTRVARECVRYNEVPNATAGMAAVLSQLAELETLVKAWQVVYGASHEEMADRAELLANRRAEPLG